MDFLYHNQLRLGIIVQSVQFDDGAIWLLGGMLQIDDMDRGWRD